MKSTLVITTMLMAFMGATLGYTNSESVRYPVHSIEMELADAQVATQQDTNMLKKQQPPRHRNDPNKTQKDQRRDTAIRMPDTPPQPIILDTLSGMKMK